MTTFSTLFGKRTFGSSLFNGNMAASSFPTALMSFDGFELDREDGIITLESYNDPPPTRELIGGSVPRGHGMFLNGAFWRKGSVTAKGNLLCADREEFLEYKDLMKQYLTGVEKNLDIIEGDRVRRYIATLENPQSLFGRAEHYHTNWIPWSAAFECRSPFASDRTYTSRSLTTSTSPDSIGIVPTGSIDSEAVVVLVVSAAANVESLNLKRIDASDGTTKQEVQYTGSVSAGDVFVFDGEQKKVFKNSVEVGYAGALLSLPVTSNLVKLTVDGTGPTFDISVTVKWKNRYL